MTNEQQQSPIFCLDKLKKHLYNTIRGIKQLLTITTIIKECRVSFSNEDLSNLCLVNKDFANIVPKVLCWLQVNFTPYKILDWDTSSRIISILIA
jgi:hypothetical protein